MKITRSSVKFGSLCLIFLVTAASISGCQTRKPKLYSCKLPSGYNVNTAFSGANADLSHVRCQYQFDQYLERLLDIAASNPKPENRELFSTFLSQARDNGALSQLQAQEYYRRYFTPDFVSLSKMHNNCSTTCRNHGDVIKHMKTELRDKERGLLKVADDPAAYAQADREFNQLLTLIDATCLACQAKK